jgi:hypothetical protein
LIVLGIEVEGVQLRQRRRPVDRFGDARRLEQVELAQLLDEAHDLARQPLAGARRLDLEDLELALEVGIVDPVVETARFSASWISRVRFEVIMTIGVCAALIVPSSGIVTWKSDSTSSR